MALPGKELWLSPQWQPHPAVRACVTTRLGSFSPPPWQGFNLGSNCGDDPARVQVAREHVHAQLGTKNSPFWLRQVHGVGIVRAYGGLPSEPPEADGCITAESGRPCVVLTADCLPVLMARTDGSAVGAFHAGWRGLQAGVLEAGARMLAPGGEPVSAWVGPAICQHCYQVGDDVHQAFVSQDAAVSAFFADDGPGHWRVDLPAIASHRLATLAQVHLSGLCTVCHNDQFYSHRLATLREEQATGRFASLVWIEPAP